MTFIIETEASTIKHQATSIVGLTEFDINLMEMASKTFSA
jgi:hypothetical protein